MGALSAVIVAIGTPLIRRTVAATIQTLLWSGAFIAAIDPLQRPGASAVAIWLLLRSPAVAAAIHASLHAWAFITAIHRLQRSGAPAVAIWLLLPPTVVAAIHALLQSGAVITGIHALCRRALLRAINTARVWKILIAAIDALRDRRGLLDAVRALVHGMALVTTRRALLHFGWLRPIRAGLLQSRPLTVSLRRRHGRPYVRADSGSGIHVLGIQVLGSGDIMRCRQRADQHRTNAANKGEITHWDLLGPVSRRISADHAGSPPGLQGLGTKPPVSRFEGEAKSVTSRVSLSATTSAHSANRRRPA